jgi:hypothetical protein
MRQPSSSGPASTVSKPKASSSAVTSAFVLASSPAMTRARRFGVVALRVIVVGIDDELAGEWRDRDAP